MCTDLGLYRIGLFIYPHNKKNSYLSMYLRSGLPLCFSPCTHRRLSLGSKRFIDTRRMEQTTMEHLDDSEVWGILLLKCGCGGHRVLSFPSLCVITFLFLQPGAGTIGSHFLLSHYLDNSGITCFHDHCLLPAT